LFISNAVSAAPPLPTQRFYAHISDQLSAISNQLSAELPRYFLKADR
jgi:hypothetical protein